MKFQFHKIDIASGDPRRLAEFYADVFDVEFVPIEAGGPDWILYSGHLDGMHIFVCPAESSGTEEGQDGVHQFHVRVSDLPGYVASLRSRGHQVEPVSFGEGMENYCLRDPDGHPWILSSG